MPWPNNKGEERTDGEILQLVTFKIGDEEFAFDIFHVREIIRIAEITRVPKSPSFIEGVINLRGMVIPIIDLRKRFGLDPRAADKATRIVVVEFEDTKVGFIVDSVLDTRRISLSCVEPPPAIIIGGIESEYIPGVAKLDDKLLILLDITKILSIKEKESLKDKKEDIDESLKESS